MIQVQPPDATEYWMKQVKCRDACPVHTDACGYVTAIAGGQYERAYAIARATNPFASICGRVCGAPCEMSCRRGAVDSAVSIRALKRFVTDKYGPETGDFAGHYAGCNEKMLPPGRGDFERIAVIGAGVSGLTVAHDLTRIGYKVTVFEAYSQPGGMLTVGVPVFRLPRDLVRWEIQAIQSLGVEIKCNMALGRDFTIADLRRDGFKAIFLGVGLPKGRRLNIPGASLTNVYDGLDFLRSFNEGSPMPLGRRIAVIGGGNVAYDVARSAIRPVSAEATREETNAEMERGEKTAYDIARTALRMSGDKQVHVICLEDRDEMPADQREIEEGEEEGIYLHNGRGPKEVLGVNGKVSALRTVKCLSVFDSDGRFNPLFNDNDIADLEVDTILFAIGQSSDLSFLSAEDGVETNRGLIKVDPDTYATTAPYVFACGDIAHGPRLFINAVASAQIAARSMHDYLRGTRTEITVKKNWVPAGYTLANDWDRIIRHEPPVIEAERRAASIEIVEQSYSETEARNQAARCLRCNINTVFDTSLCIGCNGCVDACPRSLIRLIGLGSLALDGDYSQEIADNLDIHIDELRRMAIEDLDQLGGVMTKDETSCIRCALCAGRCPTHAITMQRFEYSTECVSYGAQ
jgi:NADPH-dependent glutamate synthase beta subunit-like oxidoreductase